jgi:hypothetical protein
MTKEEACLVWAECASVGEVRLPLRPRFGCKDSFLIGVDTRKENPEHSVGEPLRDAARRYQPKPQHKLHNPSWCTHEMPEETALPKLGPMSV